MIPTAPFRVWPRRRAGPSCWKRWEQSRRLLIFNGKSGMIPQPIRAKKITDDLLRPLLRTTWKFYAGTTFLSFFVIAGLAAWFYQMYNGLTVTGDNWPVFLGFHETNFVFWIGISHAGTLISAILRMVEAEWRRPVTRCAEAITAFALMIGATFPLIHLGRPWYAWWLIPIPQYTVGTLSSRGIWPNFRSPLTWDFFAINTYLTSSLLFLFLPMIPDFAIIRDHVTGLRKRIYTALSLGWQGTPKQWHRLELAMHLMAIAIIPIAISVHTIVSFDFSMALVPGWHSTIFGPYFVTGAIFSGIAALIIAMALLRKLLHLEEYLKPLHFDNLGKLLLVMSLLWFYFVFAERLTTWYGNFPSEMSVFWSTQSGRFSPLFWAMVFCNFIIPAPILTIKNLRSKIGWTVTAAVPIIIGM